MTLVFKLMTSSLSVKISYYFANVKAFRNRVFRAEKFLKWALVRNYISSYRILLYTLTLNAKLIL